MKRDTNVKKTIHGLQVDISEPLIPITGTINAAISGYGVLRLHIENQLESVLVLLLFLRSLNQHLPQQISQSLFTFQIK